MIGSDRHKRGDKNENIALQHLNKTSLDDPFKIDQRKINLRYGIIDSNNNKISVGDSGSLLNEWIKDNNINVYLHENHPTFNLIKCDLSNNKRIVEAKPLIEDSLFCEIFGPHISEEEENKYLKKRNIDRDKYKEFCNFLQNFLQKINISKKILDANKHVEKCFVSDEYIWFGKIKLSDVLIAKETKPRGNRKNPCLRRLRMDYNIEIFLSKEEITNDIKVDSTSLVDTSKNTKKNTNINQDLIIDIGRNYLDSIGKFVNDNINRPNIESILVNSGILCTFDKKSIGASNDNGVDRYKLKINVNGIDLYGENKSSKKQRILKIRKLQSLL